MPVVIAVRPCARICEPRSLRSNILPVASMLPSANAVGCKFVGDVGLDQLRCGNIAVAAGGIAAAQLGYSPSVQRRGVLRIDTQRRVVVGDGVIVLTHLQIDQAPTVEGVAVAGTNFQSLVAVP